MSHVPLDPHHLMTQQCQKDVKLPKKKSNSQIIGLWRRFTKKLIDGDDMIVTKNPQNVYRNYF